MRWKQTPTQPTQSLKEKELSFIHKKALYFDDMITNVEYSSK